MHPSKLTLKEIRKRSTGYRGCWMYNGSINTQGYAQLEQRQSTGYRKVYRIHRVAYEIKYGEIPSSLELDHLCRVRSCVNPKHLEAVSHKVNMQRGIAGIINGFRQLAKTHCKHGHEYSGNNFSITVKGHRRCRICEREQTKKRRQSIGA